MGTATIQCPLCDGEGVIPDPTLEGFLDMPCPVCQGEEWLEVDTGDTYEDTN